MSNQSASSVHHHTLDMDENEYLTFICGKEEYGLNILDVREIRGWEPPTCLPNVPEYHKGVINLRGTIIPLIDFRVLLGAASIEDESSNVVVVINLDSSDSSKTIGLIVDAVSDVHKVPTVELKNTDELKENAEYSYIKGLVNIKDKMVIIIDAEQLLSMLGINDIDNESL